MKYLLLLTLLTFSQIIFAQDDLLSQIDSTETNQKVISAFKAMKIVNLESTKLTSKGELYLVIAHRFASVKDGIDGFFGLDNAVTQIKFVYGISDKFNLAAGRSEQAYDFSAKYLLKSQVQDGFPFTIVGFNSLGFNNLLKESIYPKMKFNNRMVYVNQLLVSRKFSEKLSLEFAPTYFHENFVVDDFQDNSQFALGFGGRYKLSKRVSLNMDYAAHLNRVSTSIYNNPLSVGVDIDTGGHVFQMHFTNSQGMHEAGFLGNTTGDWGKGDVFFGFNLVRVF
ncbi:hypothetical protein SAMN05660845_2161 [Flavobacterium swingsii]|jgi:hypothetical protein|uniref:DUF5777 domain-containing protein n=1 Tax=Flavobacterium swingsii TaxID=498292 RepID=A0A1I0ZB58_9FLAO|nr:DUF5777 family beta-barrel protein [Flavobacterium swingsii]SFB22989.1 hypothetical protein SAMN05660845_2161 [Flavobacterium swingsii]